MEFYPRFQTVSRPSKRTLSTLLWKWRWKFTCDLGSGGRTELKTVILVVYLMSFLTMALGHPLTSSSQSECDWTGRGSLSSRSASTVGVQTVNLGCSRGRILWEDPKGGLQVALNPSTLPPYQLCLEDTRPSAAHRILLQEKPGRLLHILSTERRNSACYLIQGPGALLFIETHGPLGQGSSSQLPNASRPISIAYEVEAVRGNGDPCRPCSEAEVLKTYCSADVVARGSMLKVMPGKVYDSIYINSDLVLHQNHPVFTPLPKRLEKFLNRRPRRFDMDRPQKFTRMKKGSVYGGVISHPAACSAAMGDGDLLWLIKFRFGLPITDCVIYWDKWLDIARSGQGECPLSTGQE